MPLPTPEDEDGAHRALAILVQSALTPVTPAVFDGAVEWSPEHLDRVSGALDSLPPAPTEPAFEQLLTLLVAEGGARCLAEPVLSRHPAQRDLLVATAPSRDRLALLRRLGLGPELILSDADFHRFANAVRHVAPAARAYQRLRRRTELDEMRPTADQLPESVIADLEHPGRLFGLNRKVSDSALDRVRPYFYPPHDQQGRKTLAQRLRLLHEVTAAEEMLRDAVSRHQEALHGVLPADDGGFEGEQAVSALQSLRSRLADGELDGHVLMACFALPLDALADDTVTRHLVLAHSARRRRHQLTLDRPWQDTGDRVVQALAGLTSAERRAWRSAATRWLPLLAAAGALPLEEQAALAHRLRRTLDESARRGEHLASEGRRLLRTHLGVRALVAADLTELPVGASDGPIAQAVSDAVTRLRNVPDLGDAALGSPLRVAVLGRTKAGKSQLLAALTQDTSVVVGRGLQRTTRTATEFSWADMSVVDTPGVSALDGLDDEEVAARSAEEADAVLWVYTESLYDREVEFLADLLERGTPVVVAYNAKWSVDPPRRRELFRRHPSLAFPDLSGHEARVAGIAHGAGTLAPVFVPIHARAAWLATQVDDEEEAADLRKASNIDVLVGVCNEALSARADALRTRKRHDDVRRRLVALADDIDGAADLLHDARHSRKDVERQQRRLQQAVNRSLLRAKGDLRSRQHAMEQGLPAWLQRAARLSSPGAAWIEYVEEHDLFAVVDELVACLESDFASDLSLLGRLSRPHQEPPASASFTRRVLRGWWSRARGYAVRVVKKVAVPLVTALRTPAPPLVAAAVVVSGARAVAAEARAQREADRAGDEAWRQANMDSCRQRIEAEGEAVLTALRQVAAEAHRIVDDETASVLRTLDALPSVVDRLRAASSDCRQDVRTSDVLLVRELLLQQTGVDPCVVAVERRPNARITVTVADEATAALVARHLARLLDENVTVLTDPSTKETHGLPAAA